MPGAHLERLNRKSLGAFPAIYSELEAPTLEQLLGTHQAAFVGPAWLRTIAPQGLVLGGLGGWWGKRFETDGSGMNIILRGGKLETVLPVKLAFQPSKVDAKPTVCVTYPADSRWPWPHVLDELRVLGPGCLLGLTFFGIEPFSRLALPFTLKKQP